MPEHYVFIASLMFNFGDADILIGELITFATSRSVERLTQYSVDLFGGMMTKQRRVVRFVYWLPAIKNPRPTTMRATPAIRMLSNLSSRTNALSRETKTYVNPIPGNIIMMSYWDMSTT